MFNTREFLIKKLENDYTNNNLSERNYRIGIETLQKMYNGADILHYLTAMRQKGFGEPI